MGGSARVAASTISPKFLCWVLWPVPGTYATTRRVPLDEDRENLVGYDERIGYLLVTIVLLIVTSRYPMRSS